MKKYKSGWRSLLPLIMAVLSVTGCAVYPVNAPLENGSTKICYDFSLFDQMPDSDETFIILALSGGGTRAAGFSYGVLKELKKTHVPGTDKTLLDEVDIISTVSGGSFTGAYYALFGDRIFNDFESSFLKRNIHKELALKLANPYNWFRLASPYFNRIDLAAELYDQTIFDSATFNTLARQTRRPFLIINATNLYHGARFEFTTPQFRYLGSDLCSYPVARAVAASSAFPFLLSPVSLVNYPKPEGYDIPVNDQNALEDYWNNKPRYYSVYNKFIYADSSGHQNHPYLHLMDGGLADNIGLRAIDDLYTRGDIRRKINNGQIKRFLAIVVNAKTEFRKDIDKKKSGPRLVTVGLKTATLSMDNYSVETVEMFKGRLNQRIQHQNYVDDCQQLIDDHCPDKLQIPSLAGGNMKLYVAELTFDNIPEDPGDPDIKNRGYYNQLPTSFHLTDDQVDDLIRVGGWLLQNNPDFKKFMDQYYP